MGHPTDIFLEQPSASCVCAICHDVLRDASSLNCGHTFCDECIKALTGSGNGSSVCPNCRVPVANAHPNYVVRDIIDVMQVRCPQWNSVGGSGGDEGNDDGENDATGGEGGSNSNKRKRDDDDGSSRCTWTGQVQNLKSHDDECELKVISCGLAGCQHSCMRKDMDGHRSGTAGTVMHLALNYERKMEAMEKSYEKKLKDLEKKYDEKLTKQKKQIEKLKTTMHTDFMHERYLDDIRSLKEFTRDDFPLDMHVIRIRSISREDTRGAVCGLLCVFIVKGASIPVIYRRRQDSYFSSTVKFPTDSFI